MIGAECSYAQQDCVLSPPNAIIYAVAVVLGTLIGYYQLITRYYLGEFLIIWAVVGWSLFSLIRGFSLVIQLLFFELPNIFRDFSPEQLNFAED